MLDEEDEERGELNTVADVDQEVGLDFGDVGEDKAGFKLELRGEGEE